MPRKPYKYVRKMKTKNINSENAQRLAIQSGFFKGRGSGLWYGDPNSLNLLVRNITQKVCVDLLQDEDFKKMAKQSDLWEEFVEMTE